jgi:hypothetical protein
MVTPARRFKICESCKGCVVLRRNANPGQQFGPGAVSLFGPWPDVINVAGTAATYPRPVSQTVRTRFSEPSLATGPSHYSQRFGYRVPGSCEDQTVKLRLSVLECCTTQYRDQPDWQWQCVVLDALPVERQARSPFDDGSFCLQPGTTLPGRRRRSK